MDKGFAEGLLSSNCIICFHCCFLVLDSFTSSGVRKTNAASFPTTLWKWNHRAVGSGMQIIQRLLWSCAMQLCTFSPSHLIGSLTAVVVAGCQTAVIVISLGSPDLFFRPLPVDLKIGWPQCNGPGLSIYHAPIMLYRLWAAETVTD